MTYAPLKANDWPRNESETSPNVSYGLAETRALSITVIGSTVLDLLIHIERQKFHIVMPIGKSFGQQFPYRTGQLAQLGLPCRNLEHGMHQSHFCVTTGRNRAGTPPG